MDFEIKVSPLAPSNVNLAAVPNSKVQITTPDIFRHRHGARIGKTPSERAFAFLSCDCLRRTTMVWRTLVNMNVIHSREFQRLTWGRGVLDVEITNSGGVGGEVACLRGWWGEFSIVEALGEIETYHQWVRGLKLRKSSWLLGRCGVWSGGCLIWYWFSRGVWPWKVDFAGSYLYFKYPLCYRSALNS